MPGYTHRFALPLLLISMVVSVAAPTGRPASAAQPLPGTIDTLVGPGVAGGASGPYDVAVSAGGTVIFSDSGNRRIREIRNGVVTTIVGCQACGGGTGPEGTNTSLTNPIGVAFDAAGNILIADAGRCQVLRLAAGMITVVAGIQGGCGYAGDGGPATAALIHPSSVAADANGNIFIADLPYPSGGPTGCRIRRVSGGIIETVAGTGACGYSGDGGPAVSADVIAFGLATDASGVVYFSDWSGRIRKLAGGTITTVVGTGVWGYSGDGGSPLNAQLSGPRDVTVAPNGDLYLADSANGRIRRVAAGVISTVAGGGACCPVGLGDGGPAMLASLIVPAGVAADTYGNLYIADPGVDRIRIVYGAGACIDTDCDGVIDALDNCRTVANADQLNTDAANAALNRPGADALGDACDPDISGDGYGNVQKTALGKNLRVYCPIMRADVDGDGVVSILDLTRTASRFGQTFPLTDPSRGIDAGIQRLNQDADNTISILDLVKMAAVFGQHVSACS